MTQSAADWKVSATGPGAMGLGIVKTLRNHGHTMHTYDARPGATADFAKEDDVAHATPVKVVTGVDVVVPAVANAAQTEAVPFGEAGAAGAMRRGSTFVMCSTVGSDRLIALEARLAQQDILYMDGPTSGGAAKATPSQTTMTTSATSEVYMVAGDVPDAMTGKIYRLGDKAGVGSKIKTINQLLTDAYIVAATKAIALDLHEGVVADALYEIITHSADNSWMFENRVAHVLADDYTPLSAVDILVKNLGFILDIARTSKFPLSLAATTHQILMQASIAGYAREDDSVTIKISPGIILSRGQPK